MEFLTFSQLTIFTKKDNHMNQIFTYLVFPVLLTFIAGSLLYPILIRLSIKLKYTDKPNARKLHKAPIPVVGGIGIAILVVLALIFVSDIKAFAVKHLELIIALFVLAITGMVDDKVSISAKLKFAIQILCAFAVAHSGIRITSFHGLLGVKEISVELQYFVTVFIVAGVTNSINLLDGIDGLVGSFTIINLMVLITFGMYLREYSWVMFFAVIAGALIAFIRYNWMPAKMFLGDAGSLFLGFLMSVGGIYLLNKSLTFTPDAHIQYLLPIILIACFMIPVIDTLRVFIGRVHKGKSPFSPDRTHLHHKLIKLINLHNIATIKIVYLHAFLILLSLIASYFIRISTIALLFVVIIVSFTQLLNFAETFTSWYKKIKRIENGLD